MYILTPSTWQPFSQAQHRQQLRHNTDVCDSLTKQIGFRNQKISPCGLACDTRVVFDPTRRWE